MKFKRTSLFSDEWSLADFDPNTLKSFSEGSEVEEEEQSEKFESTIDSDDIKSVITFNLESDNITKKSDSSQENEFQEELEQIILSDKLDLLDPKNEKRSPYLKLDERRVNIFKAANLQEKNGPRTIADEALEDKVGIERCLEKNDNYFEQLLKIGKELLDNIRVASEQREAQRRKIEPQELQKLVNNIKNESFQLIKQFDGITNNWLTLKDINEPYETFEKLEKQKKRLAEILDQKDELIKSCQEHGKRLNAQYFVDQKWKEIDVEHFTRRVYAQVELVKDSYKKQTELLIETIKEERKKKGDWKLKWEKIFLQSIQRNQDKMKKTLEYSDLFNKELNNMRKKEEQITYAIKVRLEKAAEDLEYELQNTKSELLKNSEITDYNYLVLQNRFEENSVVNILHKKRVAKIKRYNVELKKQIQDHKIVTAAAEKKATAEIRRMHTTLNHAEKQLKQMKMVNKSKFDNVWAINFKEMKGLITDIINVEKVIYEQMLSLPWEEPELNLGDINKPRRTIVKTPETQNIFPDFELDEKEKNSFRQVIQHLKNRAGFIMEDKIREALEPYSEGEQCLVGMSQIFAAFSIKNEKMIKSLTKFFVPYSYCPNCSSGPSKRAIADLFFIGDYRNSLDDLEIPNKPNKNCDNHYLVMEPVFIMTALNRYEKLLRNSSPYIQAVKAEVKHRSTLSNLIQVHKNDIQNFWNTLSTYFTPEKEKLWKCLHHGLNHYVQVLQQRRTLDDECEKLRKQNAELNRLLKFLDV